MNKLNFTIDSEKICRFGVPKSYENTTISLIYGNDLLHEVTIGPQDTDVYLWFTHPFLKYYPGKEIKILRNFFGHNGHEQNDLFYVHVNKCGGSAIETAAYEYGVRWARWYPIKHSYHENTEYFINRPDLIEDKVLFTSVRNPYDRLISGVYCPYNRLKYLVHDKDIDVYTFNEILNKNIKNFHTAYDCVYYNNKKVVPHVLKAENLNEEFNKLMFSYGSDVRLNKKTNTSKFYYKDKKFGLEDVSKENLKLINSRFEKDFIYFDYEMKSF